MFGFRCHVTGCHGLGASPWDSAMAIQSSRFCEFRRVKGVARGRAGGWMEDWTNDEAEMLAISRAWGGRGIVTRAGPKIGRGLWPRGVGVGWVVCGWGWMGGRAGGGKDGEPPVRQVNLSPGRRVVGWGNGSVRLSSGFTTRTKSEQGPNREASPPPSHPLSLLVEVWGA